jgi:hypothetical protein
MRRIPMNLVLAVGRQLRSRTAVRLTVAAGLYVAALVLFAGPAAACCTAIVCKYCSNSSSNCVCGAQVPVCNLAGCNCNTQCGMWSYSPSTNLCYWNPTCDSAAAKAGAQERFAEIDADKDAKLSHDELWAWVAKKRGESWVSSLTEDEVSRSKAADSKGVFRFEFDRIDADHNGSISPGEMDDSLAAPKAR